MDRHTLSLDDHEGFTANQKIHLAEISPASPEAVGRVLCAPTTGSDGRSEFVWCRLANGDLILGVFPQGETYLETELDPNRP